MKLLADLCDLGLMGCLYLFLWVFLIFTFLILIAEGINKVLNTKPIIGYVLEGVFVNLYLIDYYIFEDTCTFRKLLKDLYSSVYLIAIAYAIQAYAIQETANREFYSKERLKIYAMGSVFGWLAWYGLCHYLADIIAMHLIILLALLLGLICMIFEHLKKLFNRSRKDNE